MSDVTVNNSRSNRDGSNGVMYSWLTAAAAAAAATRNRMCDGGKNEQQYTMSRMLEGEIHRSIKVNAFSDSISTILY